MDFRCQRCNLAFEDDVALDVHYSTRHGIIRRDARQERKNAFIRQYAPLLYSGSMSRALGPIDIDQAIIHAGILFEEMEIWEEKQ